MRSRGRNGWALGPMLLVALSCGHPAPGSGEPTPRLRVTGSCTAGRLTPCDCRAGKGYQTCEAGALSECICHRGQKPGLSDREVRAPIDGDLERYARTIAGKGPLRVEFRTTMGTIRCELFAKDAPLTVANFVGLATGLKAWRNPVTGALERRRYYDGLTFHRVLPNFIVQAGDPIGDGTGGPGYVFQDEIGKRSHARAGTLAMANRNEPNTNGSQFYITLREQRRLDSTNTVFGQCTDLDVLTRIGRVPTLDKGRPRTPITIESVRIYR